MAKTDLGRSLLLFGALIVLIAAAFCGIDSRTPDYTCGETLPPADERLLLTVRGVETTERGTIRIALASSEPREGLALIIGNSTTMRIRQDGQEIYVSSAGDAYRRTQIIPISPFAGKTELEIGFSTPNPSNYPTRHILIGSANYARLCVERITLLSMFFLGLLTMVLVSSVILFACKRTELYLLYLAAASCISLVCLSVSFSTTVSLLSYQLTSSLRAALLAVCPLEFLMILVSLYPGSRGPKLLRVLHALEFLTLGVAALTLMNLFPSSFSYLYRLAVLPVAAFVLLDAIRRKKQDAIFLLIAYAAMEGVCLASYFAARFLHYGALFGFLRVIELGHILFLVCLTAVVYRRFAQHFKRAEQLQQELAALNATLEERVASRTADLEEQQNRRKTTMQNIFHDLRSPLLVLQTQVAQMPDSDPGKKSLSQRLAYMVRLTEELFLVSNLESNNVIFEEDDVDLYTIAQTAAQNLSLPARERRVRVTCSGESAMIWGDALRMQQAVQNLMDNALRHVNDGGEIHIRVSVEGESCVVRVHNTGSYIPPEELSSLFERYYRSRKKHDPHSSGLGLSIAKEIVQAHEGTIDAQSDPEQGTTFVVSIPKL